MQSRGARSSSLGTVHDVCAARDDDIALGMAMSAGVDDRSTSYSNKRPLFVGE